MLDDIVEISDRTSEFPAIDSLSRFTGVLERDAKVSSAGTGGLRRLEMRGCVADLMQVVVSLGLEFNGVLVNSIASFTISSQLLGAAGEGEEALTILNYSDDPGCSFASQCRRWSKLKI